MKTLIRLCGSVCAVAFVVCVALKVFGPDISSCMRIALSVLIAAIFELAVFVIVRIGSPMRGKS